MTRFDLVNYVSHGITRVGSDNTPLPPPEGDEQDEGFEEPRRVCEVPFGGTGVGHGLRLHVLLGQRLAEIECLAAHIEPLTGQSPSLAFCPHLHRLRYCRASDENQTSAGESWNRPTTEIVCPDDSRDESYTGSRRP